MALVQGLVALWLVSAFPGQRWLVLPALLAAQSAYAAVVLRLYQARDKTVMR
jgi:hypothetical protein